MSIWPSSSTAITRPRNPASSHGFTTSQRPWKRWRLGWRPPPLPGVGTVLRLWQTPGMRCSNWTGERMLRKSACTSRMHLLMGWVCVVMASPRVSFEQPPFMFMPLGSGVCMEHETMLTLDTDAAYMGAARHWVSFPFITCGPFY